MDGADGRWDEEAEFIANAQPDIPRLSAAIQVLRRALDEQGRGD